MPIETEPNGGSETGGQHEAVERLCDVYGSGSRDAIRAGFDAGRASLAETKACWLHAETLHGEASSRAHAAEERAEKAEAKLKEQDWENGSLRAKEAAWEPVVAAAVHLADGRPFTSGERLEKLYALIDALPPELLAEARKA